ncbi:MAG: Gfo/Idh/MocA family oxidoreductase [Acidobacteriota bacterium]
MDAPTPRPLRTGVIGTGHLGRHHTRILASMPESELVGIYDQNPEVAAALAEEHGTTSVATPEALWDQAEAIVLAVPTFAHAQLGIQTLERGLHLMVEKPMTSTLAEADALLAARGDEQVLAVGHVEFYNPAVQALVDRGEAPRFIEAQRLSPFTPRSLDVDVILDLMIHDLQLLHALDPSPITEVRCTGIDVLSSRIDIATARIELASGTTANITASRVSSEAVRKLRVFVAKRYFSIDYREQDIKGFGLEEAGETRKILPIDMPVEPVEPLRAELEAFLARCRGEDVPYVSGEDGRRALETALRVREAIDHQVRA